MIKRLPRRMTLIAAGLAAACGIAACGSSSSSSSQTAANSGATSTAATTGSNSLAGATTQFQKFVGGASGSADASKSPITFGFVDDEGGFPSFPEDLVAANAAVKFVNDELGGIEGHPIKLKQCLVAGQESQGQSCAEQFLNDKSVVGSLEISMPVGAASFHSTMAGRKPTIIGSPNAAADGAAKNSYAISAGIFGVHAFVTFTQKFLKAKTASLLFPGDDPAGQAAGKQALQGLKAAGIDATAAGYRSTSSSMLAPAAAAGVGRTDAVIGLFPSPPTCISGAQALKTTAGSKPVVALGACLAQPVQKQLGDFPKWFYETVFENPGAPSLSPDVAAYAAVMGHYAGPTANLGGWAQAAFASVLTAAKMGNEVGADKLSPQTLSAALQKFRGPAPMSPPKLQWGVIPGLPAVGAPTYRVYKYEGSGKFTDATHGAWIG